MKWIERKESPHYFEEIKEECKNFELRKDPGYIQVGDIIVLREWDGEKYTGRYEIKPVKNIRKNVSIKGREGEYCIIQFSKTYTSEFLEKQVKCLTAFIGIMIVLVILLAAILVMVL